MYLLCSKTFHIFIFEIDRWIGFGRTKLTDPTRTKQKIQQTHPINPFGKDRLAKEACWTSQWPIMPYAKSAPMSQRRLVYKQVLIYEYNVNVFI